MESARHPQGRLSPLIADTSRLPLWAGLCAPADSGGGPGSRLRQEAGSGAAPLLESKTQHLTSSVDDPRCFAYVRDYGHGAVEVVIMRNRDDFPLRRSARGESENRGRSKEESAKRSRKAVWRHVMKAGLDYLLTLTYRENVQDKEKAKADLSRFCDLIQASDPEWKYLAVFQKQKRGAFHMHLAVRGWQKVLWLRAKWREVVGEGNIDVRAPKARSGTFRWGRAQIAKYLSRYIGRDLSEDELNKKRYFHSKNVELPTVEVIPLFMSFWEAGIWARKLVESVGRVAREFDGRWAVWLCSV